jgi:hypothetical protein
MNRPKRLVGLLAPVRPEPVMTLPRTVAGVLSDHVQFEIECIDRMYLNVYQPRLQYGGGVSAFFVGHRGHKYASSVLMQPITDAFVANIHHYIAVHDLELVHFGKGESKDDIAHRYLAETTNTHGEGWEGVLFVGRAQEKASVFRTQKRRNPVTGTDYLWLTRTTVQVNYFYFYCVDTDFGPFFIKFCTYFPYNARLCINGNEWAKRQATKAGIGFEPLDNAFAAVDDVPALQAICDRLGEQQIGALLGKWLAMLPYPFTDEDTTAGYRYDISIVQAEFSLTQMLDRPVTGRIFLEQLIRDNLDIGRPDRISLIFGRRIHTGRKRRTPGTFRTRVITDDVTPTLRVEYKKAKIKQYHKEGRALRTETVINDPGDFYIGKRLSNLPALRQVGFTANRRLLDVQRISHDPADGAAAITAITNPVITDTGTRIPGLRFTDSRAQALLTALCVFRLLPNGFTNRDLRTHLAPLLGTPIEDTTGGQTSYDLRRLRAHGLITRIPRTHRYQVTDSGLRHALFLTRLHNRFLRTGLAELTDPDPPAPSRLRAADRAYNTALNTLTVQAGLAA